MVRARGSLQGNSYLLNMTGPLYTGTHYDCMHKTDMRSSSQILIIDGRGAHKVPPPVEKLLTNEG